MLQWIKTIFGQGSQAPTVTPPRRAIALICYCQYDYFSQVLESILQQTIFGKPFSHYYDLYIFQDGLQERHQSIHQADHSKVTQLARASVDEQHFFLQERNLGIAKHFDFAEHYLYEAMDYPCVVFCEHDMVLGNRYMEELTKLAMLCEGDDRIGMISMHSRHYGESIEEQLARRYEYERMGHSWGFAMFKTSWLAIRPLVQEYLALLGDVPYHQRNGALIVDWLTRKGFQTRASSQDHIKACALTTVDQVRVSLHVNLGRYIGAQGTHFTPAQFEQMGFDHSVTYDRPLGDFERLGQERYQQLLKEMRSGFLLAPEADSLNEQTPLAVPANMLSSKTTEEDVIAAYKFFLGRFPESMEVVRSRVGLPWHAIFEAFMASEEFLQRKECWPVMVKTANKIVQMNAALEREKAAATTSPGQNNSLQ